MKKIFYIISFIVMLLGIVLFFYTQNKTRGVSIAEDNSNTVNTSSVIEIKEKMFIQQVDDIFLNLDNYEGKTVKLQGFMYSFDDEYAQKTFHYVIRKTPGCCGDDGMSGFEINWDKEYPAENEWVEATGIIKKVDEDFYGTVPVLEITKLEVMKERGADFVTQ